MPSPTALPSFLYTTRMPNVAWSAEFKKVDVAFKFGIWALRVVALSAWRGIWGLRDVARFRETTASRSARSETCTHGNGRHRGGGEAAALWHRACLTRFSPYVPADHENRRTHRRATRQFCRVRGLQQHRRLGSLARSAVSNLKSRARKVSQAEFPSSA